MDESKKFKPADSHANSRSGSISERRPATFVDSTTRQTAAFSQGAVACGVILIILLIHSAVFAMAVRP